MRIPGIVISETPERYWIKKGFRYLKSKPIPAKANLKAQLYFINNILLPLLNMASNRLVKVFFCDGVHLIYGYAGGKYWSKSDCV